MSPEMVSQAGHDMQVDWWALGIVLFELAAGYPPFDSNDLQNIASDIQFREIPVPNYFSDELYDLITRLTHKQPMARLGIRGGAAEIRKHAFFRKVDWQAVKNRQMKPPIIPNAKHKQKDLANLTNDMSSNPYLLLC